MSSPSSAVSARLQGGRAPDRRQTPADLAVAGCVAQAEGEEILRRAPQVDLVFGPQTYHRLPEMVARFDESRAGRGAESRIPPFRRNRSSTWLARGARAAGGGNQGPFGLPFGAGRLRQVLQLLRRPLYERHGVFPSGRATSSREAERLVADGAVEITLLGQNVNAYQGEAEAREAAGPQPGARTWGLGRLIRRLGRGRGAAPTALHHLPSSRHGRRADRRPRRAARPSCRFCICRCSRVQTGCLRAMNRRHGVDDYRDTRRREVCAHARADLALLVRFHRRLSRRERRRISPPPSAW